MQLSGDEPGGVSVHAAWRMASATQAAQAYAANRKLAALAVAGSVGAGLADQFSDLELDCCWSSPPTDNDRTGPVIALGGEISSNFLTSTIDQFLDDVVLRTDTDPVKHMRLAALQRSRPVVGEDLVAAWRARADVFPRALASALVQQALSPEILTGWSARDALATRGDDLAVHALLTQAGQAVLRAVLAVNRVYLPHRQLKWQRHLITGLDVAPDRLAERLQSLSNGPLERALRAAEALLVDTVLLAEARTDADLSDFRRDLAERRHPIEPPRASP